MGTESIRKTAKYIYHGMTVDTLPKTYADRIAKASALLNTYKHAKLVITSRIHCALPCLAYGTPFVFLHSNMANDCRFDPILMYLLGGNGTQLPVGFDWEHPAIDGARLALRDMLANDLCKRVHEFIGF